MQDGNSFSYTYSAKENQEVLNIRNKYMPREESKLEELKRLDRLVQSSGVAESLCAGIAGTLVFGVGFCLALKVIGRMAWLGIPVGLVGITGMLAAFPVYRRRFARAKAQYAPRILQLAEELSGNI